MLSFDCDLTGKVWRCFFSPGDAPIPPDDVILVVDLTSVHGLERAVIIIIPEVKPRAQAGRLQGPSKGGALPRGVSEAIATGQAGGRDDVTLTSDLKVDEDLQDVDEGAPHPTDGSSGGATGESIDPVLVNRDPQIREAINAQKDLTVTARGAVEDDDALDDHDEEDVEMKDAVVPLGGAGGGGGSDSPKGDHPPSSAPEQDAEMRDASADDDGSEAKAAGQQSSPSPSEQPQPKDPDIPVEAKDPYTYTDAFSKEQIKAALESLSLQSRKDVFYIGSRAVCQLILVHRGKDPPKADKSEEAMQTEEA